MALFGGSSLQQAAEVNKISINTARVQLTSIFAKTDVHRQVDLMRLMTRCDTEQRVPLG